MSILFDVLRERQDQLFSALLAHVQISFIALFFALMIAVPLGIHMTRRPNMAEGLIGLSAVLQTRGGIAFPQMKTVEPKLRYTLSRRGIFIWWMRILQIAS
ncbi:hypothetical protein ABEX25_17520 [Paenibacillus thiaminolyticus]|uniref:hypothetical protein n=1 Tax=Paenibacillus thiaminolyticus TaxID=49283 RepID=UPI003D272575